jgi:putative membrane protein
MMGWYGHGMGWGAWLGMGVFWLVLLGLVVFLIVRLLPSTDRPAAHSQDTPEEILDRRFALGEIDEQTYAAQRAALAHHRGLRR